MRVGVRVLVLVLVGGCRGGGGLEGVGNRDRQGCCRDKYLSNSHPSIHAPIHLRIHPSTHPPTPDRRRPRAHHAAQRQRLCAKAAAGCQRVVPPARVCLQEEQVPAQVLRMLPGGCGQGLGWVVWLGWVCDGWVAGGALRLLLFRQQSSCKQPPLHLPTIPLNLTNTPSPHKYPQPLSTASRAAQPASANPATTAPTRPQRRRAQRTAAVAAAAAAAARARRRALAPPPPRCCRSRLSGPHTPRPPRRQQ